MLNGFAALAGTTTADMHRITLPTGNDAEGKGDMARGFLFPS